MEKVIIEDAGKLTVTVSKSNLPLRKFNQLNSSIDNLLVIHTFNQLYAAGIVSPPENLPVRRGYSVFEIYDSYSALELEYILEQMSRLRRRNSRARSFSDYAYRDYDDDVDLMRGLTDQFLTPAVSRLDTGSLIQEIVLTVSNLIQNDFVRNVGTNVFSSYIYSIIGLLARRNESAHRLIEDKGSEIDKNMIEKQNRSSSGMVVDLNQIVDQLQSRGSAGFSLKMEHERDGEKISVEINSEGLSDFESIKKRYDDPDGNES